jgi:hypothetical protein
MLFAFPPSAYADAFSRSEKSHSISSSSTELPDDETPQRKMSDVSDDVVRNVVDSCFIDEDSPLLPGYDTYSPGHRSSLVCDLGKGEELVQMAKDQMGCRILQNRLDTDETM